MRLPESNISRVQSEDTDLYGRNYYLKHLVKDYGYPDLETRLRTDLAERCVYWLRTLLKYMEPGARVLELGCSHGGSVALFRAAGYDAIGLEMSPWLVEFARKTWGIPMLTGPLEDQDLEEGSFDAILAFDVFEHLADPQATANLCAKLLKNRGILIVQTPRYPERVSFEALVARNDPFLTHLKPMEHIHLFSERASRRLMRNAGLPGFADEPAIFAHYDQYFVAGRRKRAALKPGVASRRLLAQQNGRLVQALLDVRAEAVRGGDISALRSQLAAAEADRAKRLLVIEEQGGRIEILQKLIQDTETDRDRWCTRAAEAQTQLGEVLPEFDRRLNELATLYERANKLENERNLAEARLADLQKQFTASEADRAERMDVINDQGRQLAKLQKTIALTEADRDVWMLQATDAKGQLGSLLPEFDRRLKELDSLYLRADALENERNLIRAEREELQRHFEACEADRIDRLRVVETQGAAIMGLQKGMAETETDRDKWMAEAVAAKKQLHKLLPEFDRRLKELDSLYLRTDSLENERNLIRAEREELRSQFEGSEADRANRLVVIEKQGAMVASLHKAVADTETDRDKWRAEAAVAKQQLDQLLPELDRRRKELTALHDKAISLERDRNLARAEISDLRAGLEKSQADSTAQIEVIKQLGAELGKHKSDIRELNLQIRAANTASDCANAKLAEHLQRISILRRRRAFVVLRKLGLVPPL